MHRPLFLPAAALLAALPACDGCRGSKPYTPYTLSDPPSSAAGDAGGAGDAGAAGLGDGGPPFAAVAAEKPPEDGRSWPLGGGSAEPPAGHAFAEGLVFDADGDGNPDLIAWTRGPDGMPREVWFAPGKDPASGRVLAALPGDLAAPGCTLNASLTRIGTTAVAFDFDPRCPPPPFLRARANHWIAIFRLATGAPPELALELRAGSPADGEALAFALDGRDRDGDGRSDLAITVTLSGAPHPLPRAPLGEAKATLAYFDRPAGFSRDPAEPEASLKALAAALVADGRKKTTAPHVPAASVAARRLWTLLCDEGGHAVTMGTAPPNPAVTTSAGPIHCPDVHLHEDAAMAETEAALNLGDPLTAAAAMSRLEGRRKDLDALFARSVASIPGRLVRTTAATPEITPSPSYGPIAFDRTGDLLVRAHDRIVRVDRTTFEETPAKDLAWATRAGGRPSSLPLPPGDGGLPPSRTWTLASIEERCDAPTLLARFEDGAGTADVPLPLLTPPRCAPGRVAADLLGPSSQGEIMAVRGELIALPLDYPPRPVLAEKLALPAGALVPPGAARSPNGNVFALPTARGVLVAQLKGDGRGASAKLWTTPALDNATACVPSDAADRIACAVKGAAAIYDAK